MSPLCADAPEGALSVRQPQEIGPVLPVPLPARPPARHQQRRSSPDRHHRQKQLLKSRRRRTAIAARSMALRRRGHLRCAASREDRGLGIASPSIGVDRLGPVSLHDSLLAAHRQIQ